jgi:hypothetical protein
MQHRIQQRLRREAPGQVPCRLAEGGPGVRPPERLLPLRVHIRRPLPADRILIMDKGHLLADGSTRDILTDIPLMERARLSPPSITKFFYEKRRAAGGKFETKDLPLTVEEALKLG